MNRHRILRSAAARMAALVVLVASGGSAAAGPEQTRTFDSSRLEVRNLVGEVHLESHSGSSFEVVVRAGGADATEGLLRLDAGADHLDVIFPASEAGYVYPPLGRGKDSLDLSGEDLGRLVYGDAGGRPRVRGSGEGLELWADLTVRIPRGGRLEIRHGVGAIRADGVEAELRLATDAGDVTIDDAVGNLEVATGGGSVTLARVRGEKVEIATGSGRIHVEAADGGRFRLATGSGGVRIDGLRAESVEVGVGSGNVRAERVGAESLEIGSGSGDIELVLDDTGSGKISLGTGSGDIALDLPAAASAELHAETRGGEIELDLGGQAQILEREPDEVRLTLGSGAARVEVGSGSGDIRIRG